MDEFFLLLDITDASKMAFRRAKYVFIQKILDQFLKEKNDVANRIEILLQQQNGSCEVLTVCLMLFVLFWQCRMQ